MGKIKSLFQLTSILAFILFNLFLGKVALADYMNQSQTVTTLVGSPTESIPNPGSGSDCPIPNGVVTCGSKFTPVAGCGHCGLNYPAPQYCTYDAINFAIDVAGEDFSPVYLPKINDHVIKWTFRRQTQGGTEPIQEYTGVDQQTQDQYFISLHHTASGSGNPGDHLSGEVGANICGNGCGKRHVHVELGTGSPSGITWLDGPKYLCRSK